VQTLARRRAAKRRRAREERAAARRKAARAKKAAAAKEAVAARVEAARRSSLVRIGSLLPSGRSGEDSDSRLLLLAAGALLALVMASGSLLPVATRMLKGQPR
jgi:hypothetical protein